MNTPHDSSPAFKAAMRAQWDVAAPGWDAHTAELRAWLAMPTSAMLAMSGVGPGAQVLDVAAGAGEQTLAAAERTGPGGRVVATDLSPAIVELGRARAARAGLAHVEFQVGDGEALPVATGAFDAVVCRLGLMFFPEPLRGIREMHRALRPGGRVCAMVFSGRERNPCIATLMATALEHAGLPPVDPNTPGGLLSLGRPGRMDALFREAGFGDVATTAIAAPFRLPSVDHYLAFVRTSGGPILQILARLAPAAADAAWADIRERLRAFDTSEGWAGPNELLLTAGRRP
ncbi:MAG: methyltransferase domain-containing protein [Caldimonas sp.]